jgi:hypothetical protein
VVHKLAYPCLEAQQQFGMPIVQAPITDKPSIQLTLFFPDEFIHPANEISRRIPNLTLRIKYTPPQPI